MKKLAFASLAAAMLVTPSALAQGNFELSGGYSNFDGDGGDVGGLTARGTYFFTTWLGGEVEGTLGIEEEDIGGATIELDHSFGAFGVLRAPVTEQFHLFGRLGYATSELTASVPGLGSGSADFDGVAYGVGAKFFITERFGVRGDFTKFEGDDGDADVFAISAVLKF